ncbi:hypothetical protein AZE42_08377 [Rhizopogon vesiculosus]|uniref:Cytochrome P450 n=1 Tax=Rhizopogon vesiculosus TaxID=180088 RepID=A0A1J8QXE9_9AGAM|nr:hypothetical protein AZE42_08377 [Rhizopogon vesiculosus]
MLQAQKETTGSKVYLLSEGVQVPQMLIFMNTGNVESIFVDGFERCLEVAADYGGVVKIYGVFGDEWLYVSDPRVLHYILVKEQHRFEENDVFLFCNQLMFGEGLISTLVEASEQHRKQRKMLNPVFSTSNMRELLPIIQTVSHQLKSVLVANLSGHTSVEFDVLPWLSRSALDCICEGMLGYHSNAIDTGNDNEYVEALRMLACPGSPTPSQSSWETRGKDIMSIMLKSNASSSEADRLSDAELLGQMNVMIFAGLETTTAAVGRALYMLAKHPHIQERLRAEINDAMNTVIRCINESSFTRRSCSRDVKALSIASYSPSKVGEATSLPLQFPVRSASGEEINAVPVAENQRIVMSILAANHNQAVWGEDASDWKPERWLNSSQGDTPGVKDGVRYTGVYSSMCVTSNNFVTQSILHVRCQFF